MKYKKIKVMDEWAKAEFLKDLKELIERLPEPPQGREMAILKTNLDTALLWGREIKIK